MKIIQVLIFFFSLSQIFSQKTTIESETIHVDGKWDKDKDKDKDKDRSYSDHEPRGLDDRDLFEHHVHEQKLNGVFTHFFENGNEFIGHYENGKVVKGRHNYTNGDIYEGGVEKYLKHGAGNYSIKYGGSFEGYFHKGHIDQSKVGVLTKRDGRKIKGYFGKEFDISKGQITFPNGDVYEGPIVLHTHYGEGVMTLKNGKRLIGNWTGTKDLSNGKIYFTNGDFYEGEMYKNKPHRNGKLVRKNGVTSFYKMVKNKRIITNELDLYKLSDVSKTLVTEIIKDQDFLVYIKLITSGYIASTLIKDPKSFFTMNFNLLEGYLNKLDEISVNRLKKLSREQMFYQEKSMLDFLFWKKIRDTHFGESHLLMKKLEDQAVSNMVNHETMNKDNSIYKPTIELKKKEDT